MLFPIEIQAICPTLNSNLLVDATIINNVLNKQYIVDGGVRWNAEGNGSIDEEIELNMEFNFSNLIINLLQIG